MPPSPQNGLSHIIQKTSVIPVVILEDERDAVPLAQALVAGGLQLIEVTLRTKAGLNSIKRIASEVEGAIVGAGTIITPQHYKEVVHAGAKFIVSPGTTTNLIDVANDYDIPYLPGIQTIGEAMNLMEKGYKMLKFFPAEMSGGQAYVKALHSPLPELILCPTGGITLKTAPSWLTLPNVVCVGGSWMVSAEVIASKNWALIKENAQLASGLKKNY